MNTFQTDRWYPVAAASDLPLRHVYQTALEGQELALWRDDNGVVNAWENRCPHRGLRLSLGINMGNELRCQYHGWTYESGSGSCTFVPAHREANNPTSACAHAYAVRELDGIVWASLGAPNIAPTASSDIHGVRTHLRALPFNVDVETLEEALCKHVQRFSEFLGGGEVQALRSSVDLLRLRGAHGEANILIYLQPHSPDKSFAYPVLVAAGAADLAMLKGFAQLFAEIRRAVEKSAQVATVAVKQISAPTSKAEVKPVVVAMPQTRQSAEIVCKVTSRRRETDDIISLGLTPVGKAVPPLAPGMHVSVTTPSGVVRQYSVVNRPDERDSIVIGVKREPVSRGGSVSMHDDVKEGTELKITLPRNGFPLRRNGRRPLLVAGGIGITPILAMAQALHAGGDAFEMHYFVRGPEHTPFTDRLKALEPSLKVHGGLDGSQTGAKLNEIFAASDPALVEVYTCGPGPMIDAVTKMAALRGIPEEHIRFEYFKNDEVVLTGAEFQVSLAKSGKTFTVPADKTLLKACLDNGVEIEASCEQGVCGTCLTGVVSGELEHNDTYLSKKERESGKFIMPCVSRCKSSTLVLDL